MIARPEGFAVEVSMVLMERETYQKVWKSSKAKTVTVRD
jgi:hypothetical protein